MAKEKLFRQDSKTGKIASKKQVADNPDGTQTQTIKLLTLEDIIEKFKNHLKTDVQFRASFEGHLAQMIRNTIQDYPLAGAGFIAKFAAEKFLDSWIEEQ